MGNMVEIMEDVSAYADGLCEFAEILDCAIEDLFDEGLPALAARLPPTEEEESQEMLCHFLVGWMTAAGAALGMDPADLVVEHADSQFGITEVAVA